MPQTDPRIRFFDQHAPTWDQNGPPIDKTLARLERLRPMLPLAHGQELLEVGCGTGAVTGWLARAIDPGRVTAIDFAPEMIERARTRGLAADFRCADVCSDALGFERYDIAWCMHSFPHFRDGAAALRNLYSALMSEGELIVLHLDSWEKINSFHAQVGGPIAHDVLPDPQTWNQMLAVAGFEICELTEGADLFLLRARKP